MIASFEKDNGGVASPSAFSPVERSSPGVATARSAPTTHLDAGIDPFSTIAPATRLGLTRSARSRFAPDAKLFSAVSRLGAHQRDQVVHKNEANDGGSHNVAADLPVPRILMPPPSKTENVALGVLIAAAGFTVVYGFVCGVGLVNNWPTFHAGIERLLG